MCVSHDIYRQEENILSNDINYVNFLIRNFPKSVEKEHQLDATEWFIALTIRSTCFGHFYAQHRELETICLLLPPMVCDALVAGCWRSDAEQSAMRSG